MKHMIRLIIAALALLFFVSGGVAEPVTADLDLSTMPASIAYAQALAMQREPDEYLGKTVRISGVFNYSELRQRGVVIIADNTGCCETSFDFSCADELSYPDDYPAFYARFTVIGVFAQSGDDDQTYYLTDAVIEPQ